MKILLLFSLLALVQAFAPTSRGRTSTRVYQNTKQPPQLPPLDIKDISYGEESRKFRRTVYTHEDWVKHRSSDRFFRNIVAMVSSGVYKSIGKEVLAVVSVASLVVFWNALTTGYVDFNGVSQEAPLSGLPSLSLPLSPFTLASPSLGLLLGK